MKIKNKVIWITGASSGIGEATAYAMAKKGAKLIISSNLNDELEIVRKKCEDIGADCHSIVFDLLNPEEINEACSKAISIYGTINIFYSNGGISQRSTATETPIEIDRKIMQINYFSGVQITKFLLPFFKQNNEGHIIVTTSIAGKFGFPLRSAYCASKHALYGFYETVRAEMIKNNVKVTFICPGRVQTKISMRAIDNKGKEHGKMDEGQASGITSEKAARLIVKAVEKNKRDVLIGGKELLIVHIKKYLPFIFYRIVHKIKPT